MSWAEWKSQFPSTDGDQGAGEMRRLATVVVVVILAGLVRAVWLDYPGFAARVKAENAARAKALPKVVSLDSALAEGIGVVHIYIGTHKNIHIAITSNDTVSIGMATTQARRFLGDHFIVSFVPEKDKSGKPYTLVMYEQEP